MADQTIGEKSAPKGKIIKPCDDPRGHLWWPYSPDASQCRRCGECAREEDFRATMALESPGVNR